MATDGLGGSGLFLSTKLTLCYVGRKEYPACPLLDLYRMVVLPMEDTRAQMLNFAARAQTQHFATGSDPALRRKGSHNPEGNKGTNQGIAQNKKERDFYERFSLVKAISLRTWHCV